MSDAPIPDALPARLVALRLRAGLSPASLAKKAGLSRAVYSRLESGQRRPSFDTLRKIIEALGVSWAALDGCQ